MFTEIKHPSAYVYDPQTNQYLGQASFQLSTDAEQKLLNFINDGVPLDTLTVLNLSFEPTSAYTPPEGLESDKRNGTFRGLFKMAGGETCIPIELRGSFVTRLRSNGFETHLFAGSADLHDIHINATHEVLV